MALLDRIKEYAEIRKMNLREVNDAAGLGTNAIYRWKDQTPAVDKIKAVADVLHVSVDYLLGNTDDPKPAPAAGKQSIPDLADEDIVLSFEGRQIPPEDLEIMRRFLRGGQNDK